jgi:hypothetical protein
LTSGTVLPLLAIVLGVYVFRSFEL